MHHQHSRTRTTCSLLVSRIRWEAPLASLLDNSYHLPLGSRLPPRFLKVDLLDRLLSHRKPRFTNLLPKSMYQLQVTYQVMLNNHHDYMMNMF